jgi:hypothetical protein
LTKFRDSYMASVQRERKRNLDYSLEIINGAVD